MIKTCACIYMYICIIIAKALGASILPNGLHAVGVYVTARFETVSPIINRPARFKAGQQWAYMQNPARPDYKPARPD